MLRASKYYILGVALLIVVIQFHQPARTNPASDPAMSFEVVANPPAEVRAIIARSCQDCHSNRTVWPWYSGVAPASWLVASDVKEAREHINFSEWGRMSPGRRLEALADICREVNSGDMPMWQYRLLHPSARLSKADTEILCMLSGQIR